MTNAEHPAITDFLEPYRAWQARADTVKYQLESWRSRLVAWIGLFIGGVFVLPFLAKAEVVKTAILTGFGLVAFGLCLVGIATLRAENTWLRMQRAPDLLRRKLTATEMTALAKVPDLPASFLTDMINCLRTEQIPSYFMAAATLQTDLVLQLQTASPARLQGPGARALLSHAESADHETAGQEIVHAAP